MKKLFITAPLVLAMGLSGCAGLLPGAEHDTPATAVLPVPAQLSSEAVVGNSSTAGQALAWRHIVNDPRLSQVIELALANNRDLRVAALNIDAARAQYRITEADRLPTLTLSAGGSASQSSGQTGVTRSRSVSLGIASWEIDLWGRLAQLKDAALSTFLASEQTKLSVQSTLISEVAQAWLTLGADEELLQLAAQTLESRQQTLELTRKRNALGALSGVDLAAAQASLASARDSLASAKTTRNQALNALRLLVATELPNTLLPQAAAKGETVEAAALLNVPAGLSSQVLLQRPDVRAAELTLEASRANVAAARAALFPTVSLTTSTGTSSSALSGLFDRGHGSWSFAPSVSLPIFDGGATRSALDSAKISQQIQLATYEKTIQTAFQEVADALAERTELAERLDAQQKLVSAYEKSLQLTTVRYRNGAENGLTMLESQRSLYSAQQSLISLRLSEQANRLTLFKVLGGS